MPSTEAPHIRHAQLGHLGGERALAILSLVFVLLTLANIVLRPPVVLIVHRRFRD